ncbi:nucleotide disphospho-sugar-binding domain-containing protein [Pseudonocardia sp. TRM90224]|uniref:nucleotide disphospho-sugar-binding domain-containing protein n=1 Tax=Pseudonocardia sp. TRM90224 TaxID=2812678 RepID=UPI001E2A622A|nr:nucleotide disphospho-sugar-binding domain-containing protein [Pseudonocardia sp. TRM90224]
MRVLIVALPLVGHTLPMLPLAVALRAAGHDVQLATGGDALVADTGPLTVHDVGADLPPTSAWRLVLGNPVLSAKVATGRGGAAGAALVLQSINAGIVAPVRALAAQWRPDLVVHDPMAIAAPIVAAELGVPAVLHGNALMDVEELRSAVIERHGLGALPPAALALDIAPPSVVGPRPGLSLRTVPWSGQGAVPEWLARPADRPRIVVSRSTINGGPGADPIPAVVRAAAAVDAEIVLVRPASEAKLPGNVRTVGWVPLDQVLPHCTAVVHHGGAGTVLGALVAGIPQLVVPGIGDRRINADLIARRGAGLAAPSRSITAEVLRRLIADDELAAAAREVQQEIAALPGPAEVVPELARLT